MNFKILGKDYTEKELEGMKVRLVGPYHTVMGTIVGYSSDKKLFAIRETKKRDDCSGESATMQNILENDITYFKNLIADEEKDKIWDICYITEILGTPKSTSDFALFSIRNQETVLKLNGKEYRVKLSKDDKFDKYLGVAYLEAIAKYGSKTAFKKHVDEIWRETKASADEPKASAVKQKTPEDFTLKILGKSYTIEELKNLEVEVKTVNDVSPAGARVFDKKLRRRNKDENLV